jgi:hypothetical protein
MEGLGTLYAIPRDVRRLVYAYVSVVSLLRCSSVLYVDVQDIMTRKRSSTPFTARELGMWMVWWAATSRQTTTLELAYWIDGKDKQEERVLLWSATSSGGMRARYVREKEPTDGVNLLYATSAALVLLESREVRVNYEVAFSIMQKRVSTRRCPDCTCYRLYTSRLIRGWLDSALAFTVPWVKLDPVECTLSDTMRLIPGTLDEDKAAPKDVKRSRLARKVIPTLNSMYREHGADEGDLRARLRRAVELVYMLRGAEGVFYDDDEWGRAMPPLIEGIRRLYHDVRKYGAQVV